MSFQRLLSVRDLPPAASAAVLLLRAVVGVAFMLHGWGKIQHPFTWMGPDAFAPGWLQALAALSEFGGGLAWVLGLLTPLAAFGIGCTMAVATWFHAIVRGDPFVSQTGGPAFELAAVYLALALVFLALGPGRYSLDRAFFGRR